MSKAMPKTIAAFTLASLAMLGCESNPATSTLNTPLHKTAVLDGHKATLKFETYLKDLNNPSSVTTHHIPGLGDAVVICDSGNGKVIVNMNLNGQSKSNTIEGFTTEHWKVDKETGTKRFKLGPLSALFVNQNALVVSDGGKKDGEETLLFYRGPRSEPKSSTTAAKEGNLSGMAVSKDGKTIYVCGQGSDDKTWVLACDVNTRKLETKFSADEHGIKINSPMQVVVKDSENILVLYSGKGGAPDGLIVQWNTKTGKPVNQWTLPGLVDPMGMAFIPGSTDTLAVVDNNWALTKVNRGKLAKVTLTPKSGDAKVKILDDKQLQGPVSCAFDSKGTLYIAQLGPEFDKGQGSILTVKGVK